MYIWNNEQVVLYAEYACFTLSSDRSANVLLLTCHKHFSHHLVSSWRVKYLLSSTYLLSLLLMLNAEILNTFCCLRHWYMYFVIASFSLIERIFLSFHFNCREQKSFRSGHLDLIEKGTFNKQDIQSIHYPYTNITKLCNMLALETQCKLELNGLQYWIFVCWSSVYIWLKKKRIK